VRTNGQFCPVSKAMELLDERWTMAVVRELLLGSRHFNKPRRGVPRMSPALLPKRLCTLTRTGTRTGVVERRDDGPRVTYALTEAGRELEPIVDALGQWGIRWIPELGDDLDLCDFDPGYPKRACVQTELRSLAMLWRGDPGWPEVLPSGRVEIQGPAWARRAVPRWLGQSPLASVPRPAAVS
jgi:DNA-binding HxlR family transcriptional regulator